jgi:predicted transcriptional regulator/DNA-binding XRE family transcriptional regulator
MTTTKIEPGNKLGAKVRAVRRREGLTQAQLAERLAISPAYLNLIENARRPLPAHLLIKLAQIFHVDIGAFAAEDDARLASDLLEVFGDPIFDAQQLVASEVKDLAATQPTVAAAVVALYRAYKSAQDKAEALLGSEVAESGGSIPSEEVSDLLQRHSNYFPELEELAASVRREARIEEEDVGRALQRFLEEKLGVVVKTSPASRGEMILRRYDPASKTLVVSELLPPRSRTFQLAHQVGLLVGGAYLDRMTRDEVLKSDDSRALARVALANAFAAAVVMPYERFLETAERERYDVEILGHRFRTSFEQVAHRLTTLRRPGQEGVPFHMLRVDIAGNISKRFSASGIHFARFSGACPRWNVFTAFLTPGQPVTQLSTMPDGTTYFCVATTVRRAGPGFHARHAMHAVGLGCRVEHAHRLVYADGVDLDAAQAVPVGVTCRLCERRDCEERAFPAVQQPLHVDENVRGISFYTPPRRSLPVLR